MNRPSFTQNDLKSLLKKHSSPSLSHVQAPTPTPEPVYAVEPTIDSKDLEISRLKEALKRVLEKSQENIDELARYKKAALDLAKRLAAQKPVEIPVADEHKKRLLQTINEKKELEATVSSLSFEKATLLARFHELSQKTKQDSQKEILEKELSILQQAKQEVDEKLHDALLQLEAAHTAHKQELSVSQACLIQQQQAYSQERDTCEALTIEYNQLKESAQETTYKLQHVQQHLARRIKECALLEKQTDIQIAKANALQDDLNNEIQRSSRLEASLEVLEKNEEQLRQELLMKSTLHEEKVATLQDKLSDLMRETYAQKDELEVMHKQKARLMQLEELYAKFGQIVTTTNIDFSLITKDIPFEYDR